MYNIWKRLKDKRRVILKKIWKARKVDKEKASKIALESGESLILSAIALNRFNEYFEKNGQDFDIQEILHPDTTNLRNPFELPDIGKAVDRILDALDNGEKVLVYRRL